MDCKICSSEELQKLSELSLKVGNIPLKEDGAAAVLVNDKEIIGFAAAQLEYHAAGSWVKEEHRRQGYTYQLRNALDNELRQRGAKHYFSFPNTDFERILFSKYGHVLQWLAQVRTL